MGNSGPAGNGEGGFVRQKLLFLDSPAATLRADTATHDGPHRWVENHLDIMDYYGP